MLVSDTNNNDDEKKVNRKTNVLPNTIPTRRLTRSQQRRLDGTARLQGKREVILVIRGMIERLTLEENDSFQLGRFEAQNRHVHQIDLTPYGALDRGVSRLHARIHLEADYLYITDLGSTNGTYLAGQRLDANKPTRLRKGDELILGRLPVQVMFR